MHLIENPIKLNASLHKMIPRTIQYLYGHKGIKYFRTYTLGQLHLYFVDAFTQVDLIIFGDHRQVTDIEIDFAIEKLFPGVDKSELQIDDEAKERVEAFAKRKLPYADVVIVERKISE